LFLRTGDARRDAFLAELRGQLGYQARAGRESFFGGTVGYQSLPWDGSLLDVSARAAEVADCLPALVYSPAALAEFTKRGRLVSRPRIGDVAFFAFPAGEHFEAPHVGAVTDVTGWDRFRAFKTVEGMVSAGSPRGSTVPDGVHERVRFAPDVIGFGRPAWTGGVFARRQPAGTVPARRVSLSAVQPGNRTPSGAVALLQEALVLTGQPAPRSRGLFDGSTRSAYAAWQRGLGYAGSDASGVPDRSSLDSLGRLTGLFAVE
jgi:hypothetical protein